MSGDVQPRKRKDKRRRKDELSVEEPRGTAAVFGEGDVFMHSQHEHGTGGHWCAKIIFFSLLAILVTLIGLIILENRGLSELEANSVESRYSGVLEGWLEDAPDDDHHDEHTLELKHHDEEDDEHDDISGEEHDEHDADDDDVDEDDNETGDDDDEDDEDESHHGNEDDENDEDNDSQDYDDDNEDRDQDEEDESQNVDSAENEDDEKKYFKSGEEQRDEDDEYDDNENEDDDENDDQQNDINNYEDDDADDEQNQGDSNEDDDNKSAEEYNESNIGDDESNQQLDDGDDEEDDDDEDNRNEESNQYEESYAAQQNEEEEEPADLEEDADVEVEKIEKEVSDEDVLEEAATSNLEQEEEAEENSAEQSDEETADEDQTVDEDEEEEEFLEPEDIEEPVVVERITVPAGKPLPEVEEDASSENPPDTLAEEEEYEKQQEELRRQKEQASHVWLKVAVGGALLVATHAVIRRATAPRDPSVSSEHSRREETPSAVDRRMTLILEEPIVTEEPEEIAVPTFFKEVKEKTSLTSEKNDEEEEDEPEVEIQNLEVTEIENDDEDKELYSDEEVEEEEKEVEVKKESPKQSVPETKEKPKEYKEAAKTIEPEEEPDEEVPEDVEIIDDEQLEEELVEEQEEDEEEISDVDDAELLSRLEAKYGRLPEPERPTTKKDGGNSLEDEWPGEPSDSYWRQQLDEAEREFRQGSWSGASERAGAPQLAGSARARYIRAKALDAVADARRDNRLLSQAIAAYLELLKMNERLSDKKLLEVTNRTLDRIRFRGNYLSAEPIYRLLIRRFPEDPSHRNNLTIAFLMANRPDLAEEVLRETLRLWPDDRIALAHLGFILKTTHNKLEEAVDAMRKALEGDIGAANEPRFYFHLGDALLLLGRFDEANEIHERGAKLGHFLSPAQRSLYNVDRLKSRPWWDIEKTPYLRLARSLEASWQTILKEGEAARALYEQEKEGLKERGEWSQLDLFVRGQELPGRCKKAPITCSIVRQEIAAIGCKRGQIKFSAMEPGTHVRPHVGPTNCRLRMHLGLSNTKDTYIRVDKEIRQWQTGKVLLFDDSFEHEVWHNGTGARLVLIVDVWHPDLTAAERRQLPAI